MSHIHFSRGPIVGNDSRDIFYSVHEKNVRSCDVQSRMLSDEGQFERKVAPNFVTSMCVATSI